MKEVAVDHVPRSARKDCADNASEKDLSVCRERPETSEYGPKPNPRERHERDQTRDARLDSELEEALVGELGLRCPTGPSGFKAIGPEPRPHRLHLDEIDRTPPKQRSVTS